MLDDRMVKTIYALEIMIFGHCPIAYGVCKDFVGVPISLLKLFKNVKK